MDIITEEDGTATLLAAGFRTDFTAGCIYTVNGEAYYCDGTDYDTEEHTTYVYLLPVRGAGTGPEEGKERRN